MRGKYNIILVETRVALSDMARSIEPECRVGVADRTR